MSKVVLEDYLSYFQYLDVVLSCACSAHHFHKSGAARSCQSQWRFRVGPFADKV